MEENITREISRPVAKLSAYDMKDQDMELLCQQDCSKVKQIFLSFNQLTSEALLDFPKVKWDALTHIHIWSNKIQDRGCRFISQAQLPSLSYLNVGPNEISNPGLLHLCKASWPTLARINLYGNRLNHDSVKLLLRSGWQASFLDLCLNPISAEEMIHLVMTCVEEMKGLVLHGPLIDARSANGLKDKFGQRFGRISIQVTLLDDVNRNNNFH